MTECFTSLAECTESCGVWGVQTCNRHCMHFYWSDKKIIREFDEVCAEVMCFALCPATTTTEPTTSTTEPTTSTTELPTTTTDPTSSTTDPPTVTREITTMTIEPTILSTTTLPPGKSYYSHAMLIYDKQDI